MRNRDRNMKEEAVYIDPTAVVDDGAVLGPGSRVWHFSHLMAGCRVGRGCTIGQNVFVAPGVVLGDGCKVQNNVSLYSGVVCEEAVFLGPSCVFTNIPAPRAFIERKAEFRPTRVCRGASIGANATIVCGHTVGPYALVAAGAVVTADVPAFALVGGIWLLWWMGFHLSVATGTGFIALAGVAAEFGVVMLMYLRHAIEAEPSLNNPQTFSEQKLDEALYHGAVLRVRPKAMTVAVIIAGLLPILWGTGAGSEVMSRIAAPMIGGMITAPLLSLFIIPAAYKLMWLHRHRVRK